MRGGDDMLCRVAAASLFSVIIPTLQRSPRLKHLVRICADHPLVLEVLIINNAPVPLKFESSKVRVLDQAENIYVNPAWNLGAREARGELLAILNDDILFDVQALDYSAKLLRRGWVGLVGPSASCFRSPEGPIAWRLATHENIPNRFGVFMCLRRSDYVPIPEQLRIWYGDDWLFLQQRRPNVALMGTAFDTEMGTTSGSPEFRELREVEARAARTIIDPLRGSRWWHGPSRALHTLRRARTKLRGG